jgi:hypothetical protein
MFKWGGLVFVMGILLILMEWSMARKKKEGVTWTDRQRMIGIFWVTCALSVLTAALVAMA